MHISPAHRLGTALVTATIVAVTATASAAAHSQTIDPNGNGPTRTKPVSRAWAQAHCNARSPEILATTAAHAANSFTPAASLPCPTEPGESWPPGLQR